MHNFRTKRILDKKKIFVGSWITCQWVSRCLLGPDFGIDLIWYVKQLRRNVIYSGDTFIQFFLFLFSQY